MIKISPEILVEDRHGSKSYHNWPAAWLSAWENSGACGFQGPLPPRKPQGLFRSFSRTENPVIRCAEALRVLVMAVRGHELGAEGSTFSKSFVVLQWGGEGGWAGGQHVEVPRLTLSTELPLSAGFLNCAGSSCRRPLSLITSLAEAHVAN